MERHIFKRQCFSKLRLILKHRMYFDVTGKGYILENVLILMFKVLKSLNFKTLTFLGTSFFHNQLYYIFFSKIV